MFTQPNALKINANALRLFNVFSILTTMFVFTSQAKAGYSVLGGAPVSQGRMIISEVDFEEIKKQDPTAKPSFALKETRVEADISGVLARVRVSQVFRNPFSNPMEAVYLFPLPENSAVDAYSFQIGERLIVGEVKAREEARQEYQRAKTEGRKAALLEQERANIFTQSVANIPANSEVVIHLEYVQSLEVDEDRYMFRFPMVVAPRYMPGTPVARPNLGRGWARDTDQVPDASRITTQTPPDGKRSGNDVFITVKIEGGMPIQQIVPVTHEVDVQSLSETCSLVTLKNQSIIADQDFVLEYRLAGEQSTLASLVHRESQEQDGYVMLALQPKWSIESSEIASREVHLVLDISGSMNGPAISQMRLFAEKVLDHLNSQDSFQVVAFNNRSVPFRPSAVHADEANIQAAKQFVRGLQPGGGTNLLSALEVALGGGHDEASRPRYLFLMTDALVGNDHSVLQYVQASKFQDARVFPVAFGASPNDYLIRRAAEIGRGFSMQVTNHDNATAIAEHFNELTSLPYMTDLQIDWGGLSVQDQVPARLPDLYAGKPLIVLGRYPRSGAGTVTLKGNVLGEAVQMELELELPDQEDGHDSLGTIWARQRIRQIWNRDVGKQTAAGKAEITQLGLTHQLVTQYTSFIAVEKELTDPPEEKLVSEVVSGEPPEEAQKVEPGKRNPLSKNADPNQKTSPKTSVSGSPASRSGSSASRPQAAQAPRQASAPGRTSSTAPPSGQRRAPAGGSVFSGSGSGSSGSGGGPIGPFTALFSLAGAGAAAMMKRRRAAEKLEKAS